MSYTKTHYLSVFVPSVLLGFIAALQLTGCSDAPAGLPSGNAGTGGHAAHGGSDSVSGGTTSSGGDAGDSAEAGAGDGGETAAGGAPSNPEGGSTSSGGTIENGGTSSGGTGETTSNGGDSGGSSVAGSVGQGGTLNEAVIPTACPFHTDSMDYGSSGGAPGAAGTGGMGGLGGSGGVSPYNVTLQTSPFVGQYLADATGRTLYTYGNDLPGDCNTPPVSNCVTDCLISWPILPAGTRILAPGLDDSAFGAIQRNDGAWQTTYKGWPIYYYKTDLLLGQVAGQGKAKTWHIVEKKLPAVFIMKPGATRYLADDAGHTLYVSSADQAGTALSVPVSNCTGTCLETFEPFHAQNFSVVTSLLIADFGSFVRPGKGTIHVTYKGMPLYRAITDVKSGDQNGTAVSGFTAALP
jgi:predicted lipoprotein with Yx(FWY)xxD motif